jgi:hypothetical protein
MHEGVVPWIADAAPPEPTPTPGPTSTPLALPFCPASDLTIRMGVGGAAAGSHSQELVLTNHGSAHCKLAGFPSLRPLDPQGRPVRSPAVVATDAGYIETYANGGVEMAPGGADGAVGSAAVTGQAVLVVKTVGDMCFDEPVAALAIALPQGGTLMHRYSPPWSAFADANCTRADIEVSSFQPAVPVPPSPSPVAPAEFSVAYRLPDAIHLGQTLHYTVTLTNVSGRRLVLDTCPGYTETVKAPQILERHRLNCAAVPSLVAGESRVFAMEMQLPAVGPLGRHDLYWGLAFPFKCRDAKGPGSITVD